MLKIGIIGCGKITQVRHAPEYHENPDCQLSVYYDGIRERAEQMAVQYGGKACGSVEELLKSDVDAVSICVPNAAHAAVTIKALNAGKHVLCEKPMATTLADCEAMVRTANERNKLIMVGHNQRFATAHQKARELIQSGEIGKPLAFHACFGHPGPEGWVGHENPWFFDKAQTAFGVLADLGIHKTDLIHYLLGEPIVQVFAVLATLDKKYPDGTTVSVDDNAFCWYQTASGIPGTMHVSWTFYGQESNAIKIYGTEGILRCYDDPSYALIVEKRSGEVLRFQMDRMASNKEQTSGKRENTGIIDAFIRGILTREKTTANGSDAIMAMRVIFAAETSAKENRPVVIDHHV